MDTATRLRASYVARLLRDGADTWESAPSPSRHRAFNDALARLQAAQPHSWEHAMRHEGWSIEVVESIAVRGPEPVR